MKSDKVYGLFPYPILHKTSAIYEAIDQRINYVHENIKRAAMIVEKAEDYLFSSTRNRK